MATPTHQSIVVTGQWFSWTWSDGHAKVRYNNRFDLKAKKLIYVGNLIFIHGYFSSQSTDHTTTAMISLTSTIHYLHVHFTYSTYVYI